MSFSSGRRARCSSLAKYAALASLLFFLPAERARAETFIITVAFVNNSSVTGMGSFTTDGVCSICTAGISLFNFNFTVGDDVFTQANAVHVNFRYLRATNEIGGDFAMFGGDQSGDYVNFTPNSIPGYGTYSSFVFFIDEDYPNPSGFFGLTGLAGPAQVTAAPEPRLGVLMAAFLSGIAGLSRRRAIRRGLSDKVL